MRGHPVPVCQVEAVPGMRSQERPLQGQGVCVAARKPLLLGYTPLVGLLEGPRAVGLFRGCLELGPREGGAVGEA